MAYSEEQAVIDAKNVYGTAAGKRFLNHLMNEAGIGQEIFDDNPNREQKMLGAHNFAAEKISDRLTRKLRRKK